MENEDDNKELDQFMRDLSEIGMDLDLRKEWEAELKGKAPLSKQRFLRPIMAAAAVIVLLVAIPFLLKKGPTDLSSSGLSAIAAAENGLLEEMTIRGEENIDDLTKARQAVKNNQPKEALHYYDQLKSNLSYPDQILKSIALFETKDVGESKKLLRQIIEADNAYTSEAQWILGNVYLAQKEYKNSYEVLSQIENPKEYTGIEQIKLKLKEEL